MNIHITRDISNLEIDFKTELRTVIIKMKDDFVSNNQLEPQILKSPETVHKVLQKIYDTLEPEQEHLVLLVLNISNKLIGFKLLGSGNKTTVRVNSKLLFRNALLLGANSVIIAHNHSIGSLEPSQADLDITKKITKIGRIIDIEVLDHIIYQENDFHSIRRSHPSLFKAGAFEMFFDD